MNELELWGNFRNGSEADYTLLYQTYAPVMFRYGSKLSKDRELVKDCLQQVFFTLWRSKENISTPPNVKNYLLKAIRCEVIKRLSRDQTHESLSEDYCYASEASYEADLVTLQANEFTQKRIASVLAQLPARQREVIFLKYYSDLKYEEIAAIMGIEQESVYKLTYKAIGKLQQLLSRAPASVFPLLFIGDLLSGFLL
jgi:RNA polymerase sigma-70 factor (ECF subfamily)